jgi:hypothetical protein
MLKKLGLVVIFAPRLGIWLLVHVRVKSFAFLFRVLKGKGSPSLPLDDPP